MNYGNTIKRIREQRNMTQAELAENSGITQAAISQYEANKRVPNVKVADRIAAALGVTLNDIMRASE